MIFRPFVVGSNYPSAAGVNSNHSLGVERTSVSDAGFGHC